MNSSVGTNYLEYDNVEEIPVGNSRLSDIDVQQGSGDEEGDEAILLGRNRNKSRQFFNHPSIKCNPALSRTQSSLGHSHSSSYTGMLALHEKSRGRNIGNNANNNGKVALRAQWSTECESLYQFPISPLPYDSCYGDAHTVEVEDAEMYHYQHHSRNGNHRIRTRQRASPSPESSTSSGNSATRQAQLNAIDSSSSYQQFYRSGKVNYQRQSTRRRISLSDFERHRDISTFNNIDITKDLESTFRSKKHSSSMFSDYIGNFLGSTLVKERSDSDFEPVDVSRIQAFKGFLYKTLMNTLDKVRLNGENRRSNDSRETHSKVVVETSAKNTSNNWRFTFYLTLFAFLWVVVYDHRMLALFGAQHSVRGGLLGVFIDWHGRTRIARQTQRLLAQKSDKIVSMRRAIKRKLDISTTSRLGAFPNHILSALHHREMEQHHIALLQQWDVLINSRIHSNAVTTSFEEKKRLSDEEHIRVFPFDEKDMRLAVSDYPPCKPLYNLFVSSNNWRDKVSLWSLCDLHRYGGAFVSFGEVFEIEIPMYKILKFSDRSIHHRGPSACFILRKKSSPLSQELSNSTLSIDLSFLAVSPFHPAITSTIERLNDLKFINSGSLSLVHQGSTSNVISHFLGEFILDTIGEQNTTGALASGSEFFSVNSTIGSLILLTEECMVCEIGLCCDVYKRKSIGGDVLKEKVLQINHNNEFLGSRDVLSESKVTVTIRETEPYSRISPVLKESLQDIMIRGKVEPSWICNRCLRYAGYGSILRCSKVCGNSYRKLMCSSSNPTRDIKMEITVDVKWDSGDRKPRRLIPRVIHQTWFEELSPERYPELVRLQNAWIATGWEYRFYDDQSAREFVSEHYPSRFLEAYDSLIPGAFKADLFRLLVLLFSGGVYADIDVMPETSLDTFVSPDLTFFVPLDGVGDERDEKFCLWNGFMGASQG